MIVYTADFVNTLDAIAAVRYLQNAGFQAGYHERVDRWVNVYLEDERDYTEAEAVLDKHFINWDWL